MHDFKSFYLSMSGPYNDISLFLKVCLESPRPSCAVFRPVFSSMDAHANLMASGGADRDLVAGRPRRQRTSRTAVRRRGRPVRAGGIATVGQDAPGQRGTGRQLAAGEHAAVFYPAGGIGGAIYPVTEGPGLEPAARYRPRFHLRAAGHGLDRGKSVPL